MFNQRWGITLPGTVMTGLVVCCSFGAQQLDILQKPNVVFVLADQWRAQACGYAGDPNLRGKTPHLDRLASESVNFTHAVSCTPVCTPYRASFLTGQYPLTHGIFLNDLSLGTRATTLAQAFGQAGYDTGYIGKWHVDGNGRSAYIPPERRQGFDYWKVLECTHDYNHSAYFANNDPVQRFWSEYDAFAQTQDAQTYIKERPAGSKPFLLVLAWGPPHNPYQSAPARYAKLFDPKKIILRSNVKGEVATDLAGYYAHIVALDDALGDLLKTIDDAGLRTNTVFVFTSDHGDMLGAHGQARKQRPWDESIRVPLLLRYPAMNEKGRTLGMPINTPDLLPTLLGLCGVPIPKSVQGDDFSALLRGAPEPADNPVLIACYSPSGEWRREIGGREYRGVRTRRYTYVRSLQGPWMLYDNEDDPLQLTNLVDHPEHRALQEGLEADLQRLLLKTGDQFLPGPVYLSKWGYDVHPPSEHPKPLTR